MPQVSREPGDEVVSGDAGVVPTRARRLSRRRIGATFSTIAFVAVVFAWWTILRPAFLGGPATYVVVSGVSMEPTFSSGDLVLTLRRDSYGLGDIVAYRVPKGQVGQGDVVIHRIAGGSATIGYVIQGDNKSAPDLWHPRLADIVGKAVLRIPGGGRPLVMLHSPIVFAILSGIAAFLVMWSLTAIGDSEGAEGIEVATDVQASNDDASPRSGARVARIVPYRDTYRAESQKMQRRLTRFRPRS